MTLLEIVGIAVGLAMDAFAVSVAGGAGGYLNRPRPAIRLAFHLGLFQFMMPVIGWCGGSRLAHLVGSFDHWVAFGLLALVGGRMIRSGLRSEVEESSLLDPSRGWTLVAVSVATSIDALAVGVSLAMVGIDIWQPSVVIGVVTATLSLVGIVIGGRVGARLGPKVEIAGGVLLLVIGLRILGDHL